MPSDELIMIPADAAARDTLLHRLDTLGALDHPRVEPLAAVEVRPDGRIGVRRGAGTTADLPTVLAVRGRLSVPEAAGVLIAVAQGLAALHSQGVVHGGVAAGDVVLGADGIALLRPRAVEAPAGAADTAEAADGGSGFDVGAAHDVHELAALVADLLGDRSDDGAVRLRAVLAPALAPDPLVRPEAGTFAAQADAALDLEPVRLPERSQLAVAALGTRRTAADTAGPVPGPGAAPATRRRAVRTPGREVRRAVPGRSEVRRSALHRSGRRGRVRGHPVAWGMARAGGVVGAVVLVTALGVAVLDAARSGEAGHRPPSANGASASSAATDVAPAVDTNRDDPGSAAVALTQRRVALLSGKGGAIEDVDLDGSPAHAADSRLLAQLEDSGTRVEDLEVVVHRARVERSADADADADAEVGDVDVDVADGAGHGAVRVTVEYEIGAHVQRGAGDEPVAVPASGPREATLDLVWTDDGWRVRSVEQGTSTRP